MVRHSPELAGSDGDNAMNVDKEETNLNDGGSETGDEGGEEYEIEEIIDAKRGAFPEVGLSLPPSA